MKDKHKTGKNTRWWAINRKVHGANRSVFISHNFSDVEDNAGAFEIIRELAAHAGNNAAAEAKAAGLSRVYIRNYTDLVKVSAAGDEILVQPRIRQPFFYVKYKPLTVLHAVR
jgi:hypothetical protein